MLYAQYRCKSIPIGCTYSTYNTTCGVMHTLAIILNNLKKFKYEKFNNSFSNLDYLFLQ